MSRRLLTDEQVEQTASRGAEGVAELIWIARRDLSQEQVASYQEALDEHLADFLEGLMEPDDDGETSA